MDSFFLLIMLLSIPACIVVLIIGKVKKKSFSKLKVVGAFLAAFVISFIGFGITMDTSDIDASSSEDNEVAAVEEENNGNEEEVEADAENEAVSEEEEAKADENEEEDAENQAQEEENEETEEEPAEIDREQQLEEKTRNIIEEELSVTEIDNIAVNEADKGGYIVLAYLRWDRKNGKERTREMLKTNSGIIGANLADETDVIEMTVFWEVPYHAEGENIAKINGQRDGDEMYFADEWYDPILRD